jgi:hypothetical protein
VTEELLNLTADKKQRERQERPRGKIVTLLLQVMSHLLTFQKPPKYYHQLGTKHLKHQPVGDISYSNHNKLYPKTMFYWI